MNGRLTTGELNDFRTAFRPDEIIEHRFDFFQSQAETRASFSKAKRTIHVAGAVNLNDAQARVLLVVRTEPAVVGTPFLDGRSVGEWNRSRLVELGEIRIGFSVCVDQSFEGPAVWAPLGHKYLVISEQDFGIDHFFALGTDAPGELIENVVRIFFLGAFANCIRDRNYAVAHWHLLLRSKTELLSVKHWLISTARPATREAAKAQWSPRNRSRNFPGSPCREHPGSSPLLPAKPRSAAISKPIASPQERRAAGSLSNRGPRQDVRLGYQTALQKPRRLLLRNLS